METSNRKIIYPGLKPLVRDDRDFPFAGIFKQIDISEVPNADFLISEPLIMKDQAETDFCAAYAGTSVSEDQEGEELLPEYQFFKAKSLSGDFESWGVDLRSMAKSLVKFGSLPRSGHERYAGLPRHIVVDPKSWPLEFDYVAKFHSKETFFSATTGRYDIFDNMRTWLWQHREDKCSILTGALWRAAWTNAEDGVVPKTELAGDFGHAYKIYGQKIINGEPYLVAQLSNGQEIGDRGRFYMPREVINREAATYGGFMFNDMPRAVVEMRLNGEMEPPGGFMKFITMFANLFKK